MNKIKCSGLFMSIILILATLFVPLNIDAATATTTKTLNYYAGKKLTYKNYSKVTTSNPKVVSVTKSGKKHIVKAKKTGTATVKLYKKVKNKDKKVGTRYICVLNNESTIVYDNSFIESQHLIDIEAPVSCDVEFSTSNSNIAQVTQLGKILPISNGTVNVHLQISYKDKSIRKYTEQIQVQDNILIPVKTTVIDYLSKETTVTYAEPDEVLKPSVVKLDVNVYNSNIYINQGFDKSNISVTAKYSDGTSKTVYDYKMDYKPKNLAGRYLVTISYDNVTTFFYLNVKNTDVKLTSLQAQFLKSSLIAGQTLTKDDLIVTAKYSDNTSQIVKDYAINFSSKSTAGYYPVIITYQGLSTTFNINVINNYTSALKTTYIGGSLAAGESLDRSKIQVVLEMADGTTKSITDFIIDFEPKLIGGTYPVKITYGNFTSYFNIIVNSNLRTKELKISYSGGDIYVNENLDRNKLIVRQILSNGSELIVTDYNIDFTPKSNAGTYNATITYDGHSISFPVTVISRDTAALLSLVATFKGNVTTGMNINTDNLSVIGYYADGLTREIKDFSLNYTVMDKAGTCPVTVTYQGVSTTFNINYIEPVVIALKADLNKTTMFKGELFDTSFIGTVTATLSNNKIETPNNMQYSLLLYKNGILVPSNIPADTGIHTVKIAYRGFTASYNINVLAH